MVTFSGMSLEMQDRTLIQNGQKKKKNLYGPHSLSYLFFLDTEDYTLTRLDLLSILPIQILDFLRFCCKF